MQTHLEFAIHPFSLARSPMALQTLNPRHVLPLPLRGGGAPRPACSTARRLRDGGSRGSAARAVAVAVNEARRRWPPAEGGGEEGKETDLATLGNLCVDVVLSVPQLPPAPREEREAYMERLAASPPDQVRGRELSPVGIGNLGARLFIR